MSQPNSILEWETLLEDAEWSREESLDQLLPAQPLPVDPPKKSGSRLRRSVAGFALLTVLACGVFLWIEAGKIVAAKEDELRSIVEVEDWSRQTGSVAATRALLDREADPQWQKVYLREQEIDNTMLGTDALPVRSAADSARLHSDLAMVRVHVVDATGDVYRETRFYREAAAGWLRTSPAPVFWGQGQDLETRYFHINFRQADVDAVLPAATQLDKLYLDLRSDLGLAEPSEKLAIEVAPETLRTLGLLGFEEGRLIVPSPLLEQTPADLSDSAVLVQTVAPALVDQVWNEALYLVADNSQWHGIRPEWNSMLRGMQIWQARGGGATAARWYTDTTAWLYREAPAIQSKQRAPMGLDWQTLCLQDSLWRRNMPTLVSLASLCLDPQWQFHLQYMAAAPVALSQLINSDDWEAAPSGPLHRDWVHSMAAATVVEYLVQTYGRDQLPLLLDSLRTHESWEAMIPELLGISAQEFENGWRAHLAEKYGFEEAMRNEQTGLPSGSHTSAIR